MLKTLGGDRLGAGKKMQVALHGFERSTHDLGYIWRSTMSAGTLVPFMSLVGLPGDTFDIDLDCDIKTHPTIGPLFGSYKVQLDVFMVPIRLYNSLLHNNALNIGRNMSQVKLPQLEFFSTNLDEVPAERLDISQINPSCILAYLGIRGGGNGPVEGYNRQFNAVPFLAYWDIYKNYYSNKQEGIGAVIHNDAEEVITTIDQIEIGGSLVLPAYPATPVFILAEPGMGGEITYTGTRPNLNQIWVTTENNGEVRVSSLFRVTSEAAGVINIEWVANYGTQFISQWRYQGQNESILVEPTVVTFDLENIDLMRQDILGYYNLSVPFIVGSGSPQPYNWVLDRPNDINNSLSSQEGLAVKTYQSDVFNNWLSESWVDEVNNLSAVDTSSGSFNIDAFYLSKKVYDMLNRIMVSGGTYDDWLDAVYTHDRITRAETPIYMGGLSKELVFQEVVSNSNTNVDGVEQPLGTLAGKGIMAKKHKGGKVIVKVDEPSYIMGIVSLTPRIDYSQGNSWDVNLKTLDDLHKPPLDQIGFQDLLQDQMAWWTTDYAGGDWVFLAVGKQPAWINYMTNFNKTFGNFAIEGNEMFMTLNRRYEATAGGQPIQDLTTYIDPAKFNFIFADTALDAQNFWTQIAVDITARRKMSAKIMPNL